MFSLDNEGHLVHHFNGGDVPEESVADVRAAVSACPVAALREAPYPLSLAGGNAGHWA